MRKKDGPPYTDIAAWLTRYNEGLIGPGHCYDEPAAADEGEPSGNNGKPSR